MKKLLIIVFVAISFAACTSKETKETTTETVVHDEAPAQDDKGSVELNVSDTGAGVKVKVP